MRHVAILFMMDGWPVFILKLFLHCYFLLASINCSALLSANIKTNQEAACETEDLHIKCPAKTAIHIQFANYGRLVSSRERPCHNTGAASTRTNFSIFHGPYDIDEESRECMASGSKETVVAMCQDKRSCLIPVNVETFKQDPCPRTWKYLEVAYKCKPNVFHDKVVCEGEQMTLECEPQTHRIAIRSAVFGRDRSGGNAICPDKSTRDYNPMSSASVECQSSFATEMVMAKCQRERTCTLKADEATFGSQCPTGVRKYLSISYACVPQKLLRSPSGKVDKEPSRLEEKAEDYITGDRDEDNSIVDSAVPPLVGTDMQAIQADTRGIPRNGGMFNGRRPISLPEGTVAPRCNCTETVSLWMDWVLAYKHMSKNKTECLIYVGVAVGIGLVLAVLGVAIHLACKRCCQKRRQAAQSKMVSSSQSASKLANPKSKDQRMPLYSTRYAEENEEVEPLPVDLTTRFAPRSTTLPRAVSLSADAKKPLDSSRSMHRLTTDGSFYS